MKTPFLKTLPAFVAVIGLFFLSPLMGWGAQKAGDVLPFRLESGGASLRVGVEENVASVALESRKAGAKVWTRATTVSNAAGSLEVVLPVASNLQNQELRAVVAQTRTNPAAMTFTKDKTGKSVSVKKTALGSKMSLEALDTATKQWKRIALAEQTQSGSDVAISVPAKFRSASLRVVALDPAKPGSIASRFPAGFRKGKSTFPEKLVESSDETSVYPMANALNDSARISESPTPDTVEEADIWRVQGKKIYFFNQLRGLQVIDTTDPKSPEIISSLRMPAVGEDMYVLAENKALLVRRDYSGAGKTSVVLVNTSKPQAVVEATADIDGWYVDSRKIGDRLVVATQSWTPPSYAAQTTVSVVENLTTAPRVTSSASLDRSASLMGVTADYIWIAGYSNGGWSQSSLTLFPIKNLPSVSTSTTFDLGGVVYDKFKVHQNGNTLFAVTQSWGSNWRGVTKLESYSLAVSVPSLLKSLTLVEGESLHATRFDGNRAYIVTFFQVDPLWIIDLSDPANPVKESELQVPGWSSYIQPMGDYLAAVGVEGGSLTASLFNVKDPANPSLASRVTIGDKGYTWSEANWNEKAVSILSEQNLILLPYKSYSWTDGSSSAVQLIDMNLTNGTLAKRGVIQHAFAPRRAAALQAGVLASISNRELFLVDAANRDKPSLLSEVTLAFGADTIVHADSKYIVHSENGGWNGGNATLRVSAADDADNILSETLLPEGRIAASGVQGSRLAILVENSAKPDQSNLVLYRLDKLPALVESSRTKLGLSGLYGVSAQMLWPYPETLVVALRNSAWGWGYPRPILYGGAFSTVARLSVPYLGCCIWNPCDTVQLLAFDLSGTSPVLSSTLKLDDAKLRNTSSFFAADGLVVFSADSLKEEKVPTTPVPSNKDSKSVLPSVVLPPLSPNGKIRQLLGSKLYIVDYADASKPALWPTTAIPGKLEGIAEWDRSAGLLFTSRSNETGGLTLDALLFEAAQASAITSWDSGNTSRPFAFSGRSLFVADSALTRRDLSNAGQFTLVGSVSTPAWQADELLAKDGFVLLRSGANFGSVPLDLKSSPKTWSIPGWTWQLPETKRAGTGWATPLGQYGLQLLQ